MAEASSAACRRAYRVPVGSLPPPDVFSGLSVSRFAATWQEAGQSRLAPGFENHHAARADCALAAIMAACAERGEFSEMADVNATTDADTTVEVLIIGCGFGGICTGIKLKQAGVDDFVMLEKDDDIGGTWYANTYPGCACDVQSHLYSFSFEPNPDWSHMFARQTEIWKYQRHCVDKYRLKRHIRLSSGVERAVWDGTRCEWRVETSAGIVYRARIVVAAMGPLSRPALPDINGFDRFLGKTFHSARWDHGYDLSNKRVAVIGTGASAIQFVPEIAPEVSRLSLFQRTAPWVVPRPDRRISGFERRMFRKFPLTQRIYRTLLYWRLESRAILFTRLPSLGRVVEWLGLYHLRRSVTDTGLRRKLRPNFPAGCKRLLLSDDYYPALTRANVELVTCGISEITEDAVVCEDGRRIEVDAIIYGTGFKATAPVPAGMIIGRDGLDITDRWRDGAEAFMGLSVSGFPNLFLLMGPNTGLGHNSVIFMIESQVHYLIEALKAMRGLGADALEIRRDVELAFNSKIQQRLSHTVWASGCKSWYLDANGRNTTLWPGFTVSYWATTRRFDPDNYVASNAPAWPGPGTIRGQETGSARKAA